MGATIGIRREDKNEWERRVPLVPEDLVTLQRDQDLAFIVQPSPIRVFTDTDYRSAGVIVAEDLDPADVVVAVKEIPIDLIQTEKTYLFFSHTVKGQPYNMPLLRRLLDQRVTLIDYERIADEQGRRLIFFSLHAGYAGMIETLWCLARRMESRGCHTPLAEIKQAYEYTSLEDAKDHISRVGQKIREGGLGDHARPIIFGVAGYGNVSRGSREILSCLGAREIAVQDLESSAASSLSEAGPVLEVVFKEEDMVEPRSREAQFVLQDYYQRPENYRGIFDRHLPSLDVLVNTIYWEDKYPRLVTRKWTKAAFAEGQEPRLQVIGDISCDIEGSIELTQKVTMPDKPCYSYDPVTDTITDGVVGHGPVVMAVDNLPCELPRESSQHFSKVLRDMVPHLGRADFSAGFEALNLPSHLKRAVVTHRGHLAPDYRYLEEALTRAGC